MVIAYVFYILYMQVFILLRTRPRVTSMCMVLEEEADVQTIKIAPATLVTGQTKYILLSHPTKE